MFKIENHFFLAGREMNCFTCGSILPRGAQYRLKVYRIRNRVFLTRAFCISEPCTRKIKKGFFRSQKTVTSRPAKDETVFFINADSEQVA